ncbi:Rft protein-domain-containing protein [Chlamydoabsidia padenii]|nr:Rft protein-domain-containing protein [Chlamydoabsidia padenii]
MSPKIDASSSPAQENDPDSNNNNEQLLSSTAKGASYLILLQLVSRMLTFILHQIVLRYTTAETFGIASVKLELLLSTILFISREGYRCALVRGGDTLKTPDSKDINSLTKHQSDATPTTTLGSSLLCDQTAKGQEQKVTNISYLPTVLGLLTTCLACGYYLNTIDETVASIYPYYRISVALFGAAAMIELCVEPLFIMALNRMYFQLRVSVEGVAVVLRCLITFSLTLWGARQQSGNNNVYGILAFAVAQFVYGLVIAFGYAGYFLNKVRTKEMDLSNLIPMQLVSSSDGRKYWFDPALTTLGSTLTKQSLLKHVLTEGDKMLISALSSDSDQGVYAFVVNYGCLVVRILFQPLEETGRTLFSKLLNKTNITNEQHKQDTNKMAMDILMLIIRFHVILGLIFICFGTNYTATLIDLLVGKRWSHGEGNAPLVLSFYCMYVPIMGINGITEGFVQAVASRSDLAKLSYYMVGFSLCFMGAGVFFMHILQLGAIGLVLANMVNLGIRITYSWYYIITFFRSQEISTHQLTLLAWLPSYMTMSAFGTSWLVTFWSKQWIGWESFQQKLLHIGVGGTCFGLVCLVM